MKHDLFKELAAICNRNKDGSFSTQATRRDVLGLVANQLREMGHYDMAATGLKPKHVNKLLERWKAESLSQATIKNRCSHLRWWASKIGKDGVIPKTNAALGIERRVYVTNKSKAVELASGDLDKIKDARLRCSIQLQRAFGCRREEALKFQPSYAMAAGPDKIQLKASWCKGGRARVLNITNEYQREVLARAAALAGSGSMIPKGQSYVERLKQYEYATSRAGLSKLHGLRHEYAQRRFAELAGFESPAKGGPTSKQLTPEQKAKDLAARLQVSQELGHNRISIVSVYLGR